MRRLTRTGTARSESWSSISIDSIMESLPERPSKSTTRKHDTGFPEPFCGDRNTTRRHPEANTSPDACISADDIDVNRVFHRSRRSFLTKHRHTLNHGKLTHSDLDSYSDVAVVSPTSTHMSSTAGSIREEGRLSKDGGDSLNRPSSSAHSDTAGARPTDGTVNGNKPVGATAQDGHSHRGGMLRKLRIHS